MSKRSNNAARGYTIVELMVVMLIFSVVMTLISVSFSRMVRGSAQLIKSAETDIGGLIGLEVMRRDIELGGLGLFWNIPSDAKGSTSYFSYTEAPDHLKFVYNCLDGCPQAKPSLFNDSTYDDDRYIPRAYRVGNNVAYNGSDYLVLKATALGTNKVSRAWGYLNYTTTVVIPPRDAESQPFQDKDRVIALKSGMAGGRGVRELVFKQPGEAGFSVSYVKPFPADFSPKDPGDNFLVYGVDKPEKDDTLPLRFPFNRADYYISRPDEMSPNCASGTGVLYKAVITHGNPDPPHLPRETVPILDCVADMQVVLPVDTNGDGEIDYHLDLEELDALKTRDQLKEIRVYILAQQGRRDDSYSYPVADSERAVIVGDRDLMENPDDAYGSIWSSSKMAATFGRNWRNYRWRLYTIVVQPKNL
ncbi:Type IV fimbrial biogenesis protein PilW [Citrifermentans bremense]|uniref:Type IV fimbrial biogenesis protein PilW n=1 Tax=Citrifermentans bremense TaxID=60035 RepID=A0A6S6M8N6_9BACT|nr:prepilin-type N-terminal cleavage/methylation domain-containing protein [Citrifermentans bremense]BCG47851.1 Type IV fimbrial biogenesis protein PilW [Citrifermentans bremense]